MLQAVFFSFEQFVLHDFVHIGRAKTMSVRKRTKERLHSGSRKLCFLFPL